MFSFTPGPNVETTIIKLLKALGLNIDHEAVIDEVDKHPDYPGLLAVNQILSHTSKFWLFQYYRLIDTACRSLKPTGLKYMFV